MTLHKIIKPALIFLAIMYIYTTASATAGSLTIDGDLNVNSNLTIQGTITGDGSGLTGIVVNTGDGNVHISSNNVYDIGTTQTFSTAVASSFSVKANENSTNTLISLVNTVSIADGNNFEMVANNGFLYVFDGNGSSSRLMVFNINDPESPVLVNSIATDVRVPAKCCIDGNHLFAVDYTTDSGLYIYDIYNPISPVLVANTAEGVTGKKTSSVDVQGDYAYVGTFGLLAVYDISVPTNPVFMGSAGLNGLAWAITVRNSHAYIVVNQGLSGSFVTFDISNPSIPFSISNSSVPATVDTVLYGNYAYVVDYYNSNLHVFDLVDAGVPVHINNISCNYCPLRMATLGNKLFVVCACDSSSKIKVFDLSTPTTPSLIYTESDGMNDLSCLTSSGRYVYVANNDSTEILVFETQGIFGQLEADIADIDILNVSESSLFLGDVTIKGRLSTEIAPTGGLLMGPYTNQPPTQ